MTLIMLTFLITIKVYLLLPIDKWQTELKGKCSCFEYLFGKLPANLQYSIVNNLSLDENSECVSIGNEVDILELDGILKGFKDMLEEDKKLYVNLMNKNRFIFLSISRLALYTNLDNFKVRIMLEQQKDFETLLLNGLYDRYSYFGSLLNLLQTPQKFLCENPYFKLISINNDILLKLKLYYVTTDNSVNVHQVKLNYNKNNPISTKKRE
jgi:hypothetical protein